MQYDTHFLAFWRETNTKRAAACRPALNAAEAAAAYRTHRAERVATLYAPTSSDVSDWTKDRL